MPHDLINDGAIDAVDTTSGATLNIKSTGNNILNFINDSTVTVSNGDTVDVAAAESGTGSYTIDAGSTLEINATVAAGATVDFAASTGTLLLLTPSSFSTGTVISGLTGTGSAGTSDILDLRGFTSGNDTVVASTASGYNSTTGDTTLTVTDQTHALTVQLTLVGNYSADTWTVTHDGSGGFDIVDPAPAPTTTIVNGASLDIGTPSNENVTFTGDTGSLVLNQPDDFTGQIIGFHRNRARRGAFRHRRSRRYQLQFIALRGHV